MNVVQQTPGLDHFIYEGFAGAFASFFETGDPNAYKVTNSSTPGVPELRLKNEDFVMDADGFDDVAVGHLETRCAFWRSVAGEIPI